VRSTLILLLYFRSELRGEGYTGEKQFTTSALRCEVSRLSFARRMHSAHTEDQPVSRGRRQTRICVENPERLNDDLKRRNRPTSEPPGTEEVSCAMNPIRSDLLPMIQHHDDLLH
jgi:hypothetical protein